VRRHRVLVKSVPSISRTSLVSRPASHLSLSGNGGFTIPMEDFMSLKQLKLPVKVVVFKNGTLGFIELAQKSTGFLEFGTELDNPNAMAEIYGASR
jgi:thiamine pyrophosphate-dependent acetolactate synthase large subunit-like protein